MCLGFSWCLGRCLCFLCLLPHNIKLKMSLNSMLKQHQETIKVRNETQEKLKKECLESANELTVNLVSNN